MAEVEGCNSSGQSSVDIINVHVNVPVLAS